MPPAPLDEASLKRKIDACARLASLRSINDALKELTSKSQNPASRIAEIIRKDPALTTRLLKLANSAFFGLSQEVTAIEDAVLFLGLRQIREIALATPVIEDFEALKQTHGSVNWTALWQHSIATGIITRELLVIADIYTPGELNYIAGLLHNVGKIVIAHIAPDIFKQLIETQAPTPEVMCAAERSLLGWDHAQIGAYYLKKYELPELVVTAVRGHHAPEQGDPPSPVSAALQIADSMVRFGGIEHIEQTPPPEDQSWRTLPAWNQLFPEETASTPRLNSLEQSLELLPEMLNDML